MARNIETYNQIFNDAVAFLENPNVIANTTTPASPTTTYEYAKEHLDNFAFYAPFVAEKGGAELKAPFLKTANNLKAHVEAGSCAILKEDGIYSKIQASFPEFKNPHDKYKP